MNRLYTRLEWLLRAPKDWPARLNTLETSAGSVGNHVQGLAQYALDLNQLTKLAKTIEHLRIQPTALEPLSPFRLAILSNSTLDLLTPALVASAARHGVALELI